MSTSQFVAVRGHADLEDAEAEAGLDDGHTSGAEVPDTNGDSYDYAADEADGDYDLGDRGESSTTTTTTTTSCPYYNVKLS